MRVFFAVLAVCALAAPAMAQYTFFQSTANGSMDIRLDAEGYADGGGSGTPRLGGPDDNGNARSNCGFTSFYGATSGSQTLSAYVAAHPLAQATLYVAVSNTIGSNTFALETIRSGNTGGLVVDGGGTGYGWSSPAPGITGASEPPAFRMGAPAYAANGDFNGTTQGTPWITPSGRTGSWNPSYSPATGGQPLVYSDPGAGYQVGGGLENNRKGVWAWGDLMGFWGGNDTNGTVANVQAAGQYLNGGFASPSLIGIGNQVATDPQWNNPNPGSGYVWLAIPLDSTMLADVANNPQNKGLAFTCQLYALTSNASGWQFFLNGGHTMPYLALQPTPEPVSLCLLALGGLALLRRRS